MSTVTPRRTAEERAILEYLRADAWRWDDPAARERSYLDIIRVPGRFDAVELNVLYEMLILGSTVESILEYGDDGRELLREFMAPPTHGNEREYHVPALPFNLAITVAALLDDPNAVESDEPDWKGDPRRAPVTPYDLPISMRAIKMWRQTTKALRQTWPAWSLPTAMPDLIEATASRMSRSPRSDLGDLMRPAITMLAEGLLRIAWLFECEERDGIAFGPVSERRLPRDPGEAAVTLRRFAEQQPELRKVPAFIHVAPREASSWMRPRDYARMQVPHADKDQVRQVASDALTKRRYIHDHLAVIEVDRKPIKSIMLAPEVYDRAAEMIYLEALVVHEKGAFVAEVMVSARVPEAPTYGLHVPFGGYAWRSLERSLENLEAGHLSGTLPPDRHVAALVIAAWRDLVVANVKEEQYDSEVTRGGNQKPGKASARKDRKAQTRVIHYLPRTVVIRREEAAAREAAVGGPKRQLSRPFRVGAFARMLRPGTKRSADAQDFAEEIGMPLRDDQTCVRPHIRGGTDEEREALLAEDDVRLWRSWAAIDLLYVRATPGAVE